MGLGFSIRLAPGVRVRASSRGVRTSIGPRAARIHVGAGRTGFSTGAGPVGFYTSLGSGGTSRRTGTATVNRELAAAARREAAGAKADEAGRLADALSAIVELHRAEFAPARPPVAPPPPGVDRDAVRRRHVAAAKAETSIFARRARRAAIQEAERRASAEVTSTEEHYRAQRVAWQAHLDQEWAALAANDPDTVLATLARAFEDNEAAAAAVGVHGAEVSLVVVVPAPDAVPERRPTTTPAGNLSLKTLTKGEAAELYRLLVAGHVLATVKECFAVAPGLTSARVVAVRRSRADSYGRSRPEALVAARVERRGLDGIRWSEADAAMVLQDASSELVMVLAGRSRALQPIDLTQHQEVGAVLDAVDLEDLEDVEDLAGTEDVPEQ
jgi:hypothetical protein